MEDLGEENNCIEVGENEECFEVDNFVVLASKVLSVRGY
tara:strand:+ start:446 stop:562 length:117 start_codon:yes stop_codon:yes gene_type:complete